MKIGCHKEKFKLMPLKVCIDLYYQSKILLIQYCSFSIVVTKKEISTVDLQNMHRVYDNWPEIAKEYFSKTFSKIEIRDIDKRLTRITRYTINDDCIYSIFFNIRMYFDSY